MAIGANRFRGLQQVLDLREIRIGVAIVDKLVEVFGGLPDPFLSAVQREIFLPLGEDEVHGLVGMILSIEFRYPRITLGRVASECLLRFSGLVARCYEIIPFVKALQRFIGSGCHSGSLLRSKALHVATLILGVLTHTVNGNWQQYVHIFSQIS